MTDVTPPDVQAKNTARRADEETVFRYRGERLTYERRYFLSLGQAGRPVIVWSSDSYEIHGDGRQFVSGDGAYLKPEGTDDRGAIAVSKR